MTKRFTQLGLAALVLYLIAAAALFGFQRSFFYLPQSLHLSPTDVGVTHTREVRLATADSVHIEAWYSPAPEGQTTLVFFHGNGGLISAFGDRIRHAQGHGYGIMLVEYRGYAGLSGTPSEEGLYADGRAALDWLAKQGVPSSSVFLYGESLGSGVAVKLASERHVAGVILESPYTSAAAVGELRFWMFPVSWLVWDRYDSLSRIKEIHAPLLVMHGGEDNVIPQSQGRALFDAAAEPKQGYFPPEAHHVDLARYGGENKLDDFIAKFWNAGHD